MTIQANPTYANYVGHYQLNTRVHSESAVKISDNTNFFKSYNEKAAKLMKSEKLRQTVTKLSNETSDIQAGITKDQILEQGIGKSQDIIGKMTRLSVSASDSSITLEDRYALHQELKELAAKLDTIAIDTSFQGEQLMKIDGEESASKGLGIDELSVMTPDQALESTDKLAKARERFDEYDKAVKSDRDELEKKIFDFLGI